MERDLTREEKGHVLTEAGEAESEDTMPLALKMEERPQAKEHRWPLKNRKGKAMDSPLDPPRRNLDASSVAA